MDQWTFNQEWNLYETIFGKTLCNVCAYTDTCRCVYVLRSESAGQMNDDLIRLFVCLFFASSWSHSCVSQRSQLLFKIADILESRLEDFAKLESLDQGKPIWLARTMDIPRAVHNFRFYASYILHDLNK